MGVGLAEFIKICTCGVYTLPTNTSYDFPCFSGTVLLLVVLPMVVDVVAAGGYP